MDDKSVQLYESILSTHDITCGNCGIIDSVHNIDEYEACEFFYTEGWRARNNTYCPRCAKKKLKNPNK